MEQFFTDLLTALVDFINSVFGTTITFVQLAYMIIILLIVLLLLTATRLNRTKSRLKKLRRRVIAHQIQVVTVPVGKKGKTKKIIKTTNQLRKANKKAKTKVNTAAMKTKVTKKKNAKVTTIDED